MTKIIDKIVIDDTPPSNPNTLWIQESKGNNLMSIKKEIGGEWRNVGTASRVDTVSQLDTDADTGHLSAVAPTSSSVPVSSLPLGLTDMETETIDVSSCSLMYGIKIQNPSQTFTIGVNSDTDLEEVGNNITMLLQFMALNLSQSVMFTVFPFINITTQGIVSLESIVGHFSTDLDSKEWVFVKKSVDGYDINYSAFQELSYLLSNESDPIYALGSLGSYPEMIGQIPFSDSDFMTIKQWWDSILHIITYLPKDTGLYFNSVHGWQKVILESDYSMLESQITETNSSVSEISGILETKTDLMEVVEQRNVMSPSCYPNKYNIVNSNALILVAPENSNIYNEYIIELHPSSDGILQFMLKSPSSSSNYPDIIWANGDRLESVVKGNIYLICIHDNLGIYTVFTEE